MVLVGDNIERMTWEVWLAIGAGAIIDQVERDNRNEPSIMAGPCC